MLLEAFDAHLECIPVVLVLPEGLEADPESQDGVEVSGITCSKMVSFLFVYVMFALSS